MLEHFGLHTANLSEQVNFTTPAMVVTGKTLLYDGDLACYEVTAGVAKIETALRRFERKIYETMFLARCNKARVHLTPKGCSKNGRGNLLTVKPYQQQRSNKNKPALLDVLRSPLVAQYFQDHPDIEIILHYDIEADDGLMIDAYTYNDTVLVSGDKDLFINPFMSYNEEDGRFIVLPKGERYGWIERKFWNTPSGRAASKMVGKGTKFFLAQMLMGDSADNVQGIIKYNGKLCGEAGAYDALSPIENEDEAVNLILGAYKTIDQNPIPEGEAMWLLRNREDSVYKYLSSTDLTDSNRDYLDTCYFEREWKVRHETVE